MTGAITMMKYSDEDKTETSGITLPVKLLEKIEHIRYAAYIEDIAAYRSIVCYTTTFLTYSSMRPSVSLIMPIIA
jgi:hypothetical protein